MAGSLSVDTAGGLARRVVGCWLVLSLALGTVVVPEAWAADYYVSPSGDDGRTTAEAQSPATPWKTLTHALGQATSGDVVYAAAGTYDTPGNGETFPLALVDGVAIIGDASDPASRTISAPAGSNVFFNDDTPLGTATRLAGVTLLHDADTGTPMMEYAVDTATMAPHIDHNVFAGSTTEDRDKAIIYYDDGPSDGVFTPTIDNNTFTDLYAGTWMYDLSSGTGNTFSPVITNNTFTDCDYPIRYTMSTTAEGTVGGLVEGNTFSGTSERDIYLRLDPASYGTGLLVNPTITGNDMRSGASTNVAANLYGGSSYSGDVTFSPTISNNTMDAMGYNVLMSGWYSEVFGDYTIAPTISGNSMTGASSTAVSFYLTDLSVSGSSQRNVLSPTITNNTITTTGDYPTGIWVDLSSWFGGQMEGTATIAGNTISGAYQGIDWEMSYFSDGDGMDWNVVLSNNTVTSPSYTGISFSMYSMSFSGSGSFDLTVEGNTVTEAGDDGMYLYPADSWGSSNQIDQTVLIRGNTVTGAAGDGMWLSFDSQTSNTLDATISDNVLRDNDSDGLAMASSGLGSNAIRVECNTITGNLGNGVRLWDGNDPPPDFGGGNLSAAGGNGLSGNGAFDFYNEDGDPVSAQSNWWGTTDGPTIDGNISDDEETTGGAVDFSGFLSAAPSVTLAATLTDAVAVDVAPAGASIGDTLEYTAVIDSSGSCGDASVSFTAPVDANTTVVPGSVTTTRGIVQSEDPPTVAVGVIGGGETATVTWQVVVDAGTSVETQGTVSATRTGSTLSDDPDTATATDATVTTLVVAQAGTVQFAVAATSVAEDAGTVTLDVTRTGGTNGPITVDYASADGSAVTPDDYTGVSGQLSWGDGDGTTQQIVVPIVDDADVEGDETFTVTLTDQAAAAFVGSPATVTVTIQDDEQAEAIPTLGQWGVALFACLLLLLGAALLRRRRLAAAATLALAVLLVPRAEAAEAKPRPRERSVTVSTVASYTVVDGVAELTLASGEELRIPAARLRVREGHVRGDKAQKGARTRASREEKRALREQRKASTVREAATQLLREGVPVLVAVKLDSDDGRVIHAKVWTFDTLEKARAELDRRDALRARARE